MSDGVTNPRDTATGAFAEEKGKGKTAQRVHDNAPTDEDDDDEDDDDDDDDEDFEGENENDGEDIEDGAEEVDLDNIVEGGRRTRGAKIDFAKAAAENPADDEDDEDDEDFQPPAQDTEMSG
ncbi:Histone chaperone domain CHZ [Cordyceps militaris CM01]|uniref:Histone chaperone domain CHZ n=2 Tax=Cordyceps militaris TaxID=73501 RepID=G3JB18_CORMM|nr:Histone chaperone domain CHZ [Cordyceps militaris CM01]ATY60934.1 Histone chaperone domain CHZ [Cordyceps militaris]EGX95230.1 Histone chaperone domain CHZ [Cordyceps militaris CM01]